MLGPGPEAKPCPGIFPKLLPRLGALVAN